MKNNKISDSVEKILCIVVLITILVPFLWMVSMAFKQESEIMSFPPTFFPKEFTGIHIKEIFSRIPMLKYIRNTLVFSVGVGLISVFFDSLAGYAFARLNFKGRDRIFALILLTMMIPFNIIMIPLYIEVYKMNLLNTFIGLILPRAASAYGIFFMRSFFIGLPKDFEESARLDGLGEFGIYFRIMFPLCKPAVITMFIFVLMSNWNDLLYPMMMTSSTDMRTLSAGMAMFVGEGLTEVGPSMAGALVSILPLFIVYCFAQKYFVQGIALSGMKE
nr:carbohydrate ABC transporter permease [uncultured Blautia sp.]